MRSHSTKYQLKEKSPEANFILSNTLQALLLFKIQKHSEFSVDLRQSFSHAATVHLARCTRLFLPGQHPRTRAWRLPGVGGAPGRPRRRVLRRPRPRYSRQGARTAAQRRSAPPIAPLLSAWPHACQRTPVAPSPWPGKHGTCSLPPTGPRRPVLSNSTLVPNPSPITT